MMLDLLVEARPQIDIAVRVALYLAAAVEQPRAFCVLAVQATPTAPKAAQT
jgi:hypothetical protein